MTPFAEKLFAGFNFELLDSPEFKEDAVREALIKPLLNALGYSASGKQKIVRSKGLNDPSFKDGSKKKKNSHIPDYLLEVEGVIAQHGGATLEEINDELIIKGLELGFLDVLSREYQDITPFLLANFEFNEKSQKYTLSAGKKFRSQIDLKLRIRYYLVSFLRRKEREGENPTLDDIVLNIMPLLKNGRTPENQTILTVLEEVAVRVGEDSWQLAGNEIQPSLFSNMG